MNIRIPRFPPWVLPTLVVVLLDADRALGCAVCFGDPESRMVKGAFAGILVMVGVVGFVLLGVAGTSLFWIQRGRRLARAEEAQQDFVDTPSDQNS